MHVSDDASRSLHRALRILRILWKKHFINLLVDPSLHAGPTSPPRKSLPYIEVLSLLRLFKRDRGDLERLLHSFMRVPSDNLDWQMDNFLLHSIMWDQPTRRHWDVHSLRRDLFLKCNCRNFLHDRRHWDIHTLRRDSFLMNDGVNFLHDRTLRRDSFLMTDGGNFLHDGRQRDIHCLRRDVF